MPGIALATAGERLYLYGFFDAPCDVAERKPSFSPIPASGSNFNPQNTSVFLRFKIIAFLELGEKSWFSFGH